MYKRVYNGIAVSKPEYSNFDIFIYMSTRIDNDNNKKGSQHIKKHIMIIERFLRALFFRICLLRATVCLCVML